MQKIINLISFRIQQLKSSIRFEGWIVTIYKTVAFIGRQTLPLCIRNYRPWAKKEMKDLLFINGCSLDHCRRYRIHHPMEQLISLGMECNECWYEALKLEDLKYYRGFIFYRTPITPLIQNLIQEGKALHKTFFFDIDDLVMDPHYTKNLPYLKTLSPLEQDRYQAIVCRMKKTLQLCDAAITSTPVLAKELRQWLPNVFVNPNVASDSMIGLSEAALQNAYPRKNPNRIVIGYLSGSLSHNPDFTMIAPALAQVLSENKNVELRLIGLIELPKALAPYRSQIKTLPLMKWTALPKALADLDINLAPLEDSLFNHAKSENRWMEAAWLKIPTLASHIGRVSEVTQHLKDSYLVQNTTQSWLEGLRELVYSASLRNSIGLQAYYRVKKDYHTLSSGIEFKQFILNQLAPNIGFILPMTDPRGGVHIVIRHAHILKKNGYDVTLFSKSKQGSNIIDSLGTLPVVSLKKSKIQGSFDHLVSTLWSTNSVVSHHNWTQRKSYLVQGYEVDFMPPSHRYRKQARATYQQMGFQYLTISRWCEDWLKKEFAIHARFAPNGIDLNLFQKVNRNFREKKWRILIEGSALQPLKNIDESFQIIQQLPEEEFEIWYLTYEGKPKSWYRVDQLFQRVPYKEVPQIYQKCHLLLKTSFLESFSYPPLEMMATGGLVVARANSGNLEYLKHGENCLSYDDSEWKKAVSWIEELKKNENLVQTLVAGGLKVAKNRNWDDLESQILKLYCP